MEGSHWIFILNVLFILILWILTQYHKRMDILVQSPYDDRIHFYHESYLVPKKERHNLIVKQSRKMTRKAKLITKVENKTSTINIVHHNNTILDTMMKSNESQPYVKNNNTIEKHEVHSRNQNKTNIMDDLPYLQEKNNTTQQQVVQKPTTSEFPTIAFYLFSLGWWRYWLQHYLSSIAIVISKLWWITNYSQWVVWRIGS